MYTRASLRLLATSVVGSGRGIYVILCKFAFIVYFSIFTAENGVCRLCVYTEYVSVVKCVLYGKSFKVITLIFGHSCCTGYATIWLGIKCVVTA